MSNSINLKKKKAEQKLQKEIDEMRSTSRRTTRDDNFQDEVLDNPPREDYDEQLKDDILLGQPQFVFDVEPAVWTGPLYYKLGDHGRAFWVSLALIAIGVLLYIFDNSLMGAILMGLLAIMVYVHAKREPPLAEFEVAPTQIRINDTIYSYNDVHSFWIDYHPEFNVHELSLHLKQWHRPHLKIPLQANEPGQIRGILLEFIPEEEHKHTAAEILLRRIGL
jgi:hypothetical protein